MIARLFPAEERNEILSKNLISKAKALPGDPAMEELMVYWRIFVEPSLKTSCGACYERIHRNWLAIYGDLIQLQKEENTLNDIN